MLITGGKGNLTLTAYFIIYEINARYFNNSFYILYTKDNYYCGYILAINNLLMYPTQYTMIL